MLFSENTEKRKENRERKTGLRSILLFSPRRFLLLHSLPLSIHLPFSIFLTINKEKAALHWITPPNLCFCSLRPLNCAFLGSIGL
ncbi:hypothetical protein RJT34_33449 [Clitoria ternatea]|uniref:Uncharacterized protein n=1 Tax=Clitoria ternatea TaxID=43366 RepID=A0AAN9I6U5_CLITE